MVILMKKDFKFFIAMIVAKNIAILLKLFGRNASHLPGWIALKICPNLLGKIDKPEQIIAVTGTNGKTTVCNILIDILKGNGYDVLNNRLGSNIDAGITSSLILGSNVFGKAKKKIAVLEVDERSSKKIYPYIKPNYIVCTNLFRDSMKRNAHTEFILDIINSAIPEESKLILNADDLICSGLGTNNKKVYFGIDKLDTDVSECINIINDIRTCPKCDSKLEYDYLRYHHIGKAHCSKCDFKSPESNYLATRIDYEKNKIDIKTKKGTEKYNLINNNIINIYNMLAAIAVLSEFGLTNEQLKNAFKKYKIVESRYSEEEIDGKKIIKHLAKGQNPVACSRTFDYIKQEKGKKAIMLNLDDYYDARESSENMAWIYDTDYELLNSEDIVQIIIGGARVKDHYLRLLLAGIPKEKISFERNEIDGVKHLDIENVDKIFILYDVFTKVTADLIRDEIVAKIKQKQMSEKMRGYV